MPKFRYKAKVIQAVNGVRVNILFIIVINITVQGHMFEICTMVSKIYNNFIDLEAQLSMMELTFKILNRSVPVFPEFTEMGKPKGKSFFKLKAQIQMKYQD